MPTKSLSLRSVYIREREREREFSGSRVYIGFRAPGLGFKILGFWDSRTYVTLGVGGLGFRVWGLGFRVLV